VAIRFVSGQSATQYDGTFSNDVTLSGVQTDSFLILVITGGTGQEVTGITSNSGTASLSSWTRAAGPYAGGGSAEGEIWWARVTSGGTVGVRPVGTVSDSGYSIHEFRNVSTGTPQIGSAQNVYVSGESAETGTISVTTGDLLFALYANESGDRTLTWGDGGSGSAYTQLENVTSHMHKTAYKIAGSDAAFSAECSWTSAFDPILMLVAFDAAPATEIIKVVDPDMGSGYDYDSLSDWEADLGGTTSGNLPADNEIAVAKCRCTGGTADTTATWISGWTTDSTHYIKIWTDPAESYRHAGVWSDSKYRICPSGMDDVGIAVWDEGTVGTQIIGIQFQETSYNSYATEGRGGIFLRNGVSTVVSHNIFRQYGSAAGCYGIYMSANCVKPNYFYNNLFYDFDTVGGYGMGSKGDGPSASVYNRIYNNTFIHCTTGINDDGNRSICYNNLFHGCTEDIYNISESGHSDYNASTNSSIVSGAYEGAHDRVSQTFTFKDHDGKDFHLSASDTGAKGYGRNLYNDAYLPFQTDIDGQDRGGSGAVWDIGADECVAAASSTRVPFRRMNVLLRLCLSVLTLFGRLFR